MSELARKLTHYEDGFKSHKNQVDKFYQKVELVFTDEYFPSIRFTRRELGEGSLVALGTKYEINFQFVVFKDTAKSILEVSLPATVHNDRQRLGLWYVDRFGNVTNPGEDFSSNLIDDTAFVLELVDTAQQEYFSLVKKTLPTDPA